KSLRASTSVELVDDALDALDIVTAVSDTSGAFTLAKNLLMLGAVMRFGAPERAAELMRSASRDGDHVRKLHGPVVIVIGGTDANVESSIAGCEQVVREAFKDFSGTVLSGGTEQGVSGLVGVVGSEHGARDRFETVGYIPENVGTDAAATPDERYSQL